MRRQRISASCQAITAKEIKNTAGSTRASQKFAGGGVFEKVLIASDLAPLRFGKVCSNPLYTMIARWPHAEWTRNPSQKLPFHAPTSLGAS